MRTIEEIIIRCLSRGRASKKKVNVVNVNVDVFFIPFVIGIRDKDASVVAGSGYETCFPRQKRLSRFERSTFWERSTEPWKGTQATFSSPVQLLV